MELIESTLEEVIVLTISTNMIGDTESQILCEKVKKLVENGNLKIVFNLKNTKLINSIGIGILMSCWTTLSRADGQLKLVNVAQKIYDLLELTELNQFFETYDSIKAAVADFL